MKRMLALALALSGAIPCLVAGEGGDSPRDAQFGLLSLLGFVTVCAILSALSAVVGTASSVLLMLMALALWARQGLLALRMFMAACLGADGRFAGGEGAAVARQLLVVLLAAALCGWYCLRRLWMTE